MRTGTANRSPRAQVLGAVVFLLLVTAVAVIGSLAAAGASEQYASVRQPPWAPPSWVFGPVWTILYALIAASGWLVWREAGPEAGARPELGTYLLQLVLNAAWPPLFFGAGLYGVAAIEIVVLLLVIVVNVVLFHRRQRVAAWLLLPYLVWTAFAGALNFAVWMLNP